ncbi:hypothetical protein V491_03424 [Pseudogymnoascus sp. VKM F-3775]|nr:hypothetical protein V491_03424 [Pseudogymnoascus sp. VKM F-3775]
MSYYSETGLVLFQGQGQLPDYGNERVFQRNRLPARAYHIPATSLLLNGMWDFQYASTPLEAPEPDYVSLRIGSDAESTLMSTPLSVSDDITRDNKPILQLPEYKWSKINVPGHWQLQGFGSP